MSNPYSPILLQILLAAGFAGVTILLSVLLGKYSKGNPTKNSAYECGMLPSGSAQPRFSVKFYMVAMLFILFDIEVVFMYPWAVVYKDYLVQYGGGIFLTMFFFVAIICVGYLYALKKGALDWRH
jgi:NADH-quinone oxidoreductase subunit A